MNSSIKLAALAGLALCAPALAQTDYTVSLGAAHSDNVRRVPDNAEDSTVGLVGLALDHARISRRLTTNVAIDVNHRLYSLEGVDDETLGFATANALFDIAPGVFDWFGEYEFGTVQTNPFGTNRPGNRGNVQAWSTGPNLHLVLGNITALELMGRYIDTSYEALDLDSETLQGGISFLRPLTPHRTLSLNVTADRVEYDRDLATGAFDRQSAFVGFNSEAARGTLNVELGYNELHDAGEVMDGMLVAIGFVRQLTPRTSLSLDYDQRISDAGDMFRRFGDAGGGRVDVVDFADVANPIENRRFGAMLRLDGQSTDWHLGVTVNDMDVNAAEARDRRRTQLRFGVSRSFASAWDAALVALVSRNEFDLSAREDDDLGVSFTLARRLSSRIGVRLGYDYSTRDSDDPQAEFDENQYSLMFTYGNQ